MSSACISSARCVDARAPVRATYVNLYKWPESDAEFVKSVARNGDLRTPRVRKWGPEVVDSYSCRQMYLRSYKFSRKESMPEKTMRCFGKVMERATDFPIYQRGSEEDGGGGRRRSRRKKKGSCGASVRKALYSIFHRLLSCTTTVEVV